MNGGLNERYSPTIGARRGKRIKRVKKLCAFHPGLWARLQWVATKEGVPVIQAIRGLVALGITRYRELGELPRREA